MRGENGIRPGGSLPHRLRAEPFGPGPLCRFATSPHTVGSHPRRGGQGVLGSLCEGAATRRRLRERTSPLPEVFLYYAAGWLSVSVESVSVLSLSAVDSDAMMSVTWLEPSRFSFFCASSAAAIRPPICWMFGSVAV